MSDKEKVVKGLEYCSNDCSLNCPYYSENECVAMLASDTITLLKEQEQTIDNLLVQIGKQAARLTI